MQLTRYTDYSLRVLMYLAVRPGRLATITEISEAYAISRNHLVKVVHQLGGLGYIRTRRGKQGGIELGRPPREINIGAVVRDVEKTLDIVNCEDPSCPILPVCNLKTAFLNARNAFLGALDQYTLEDLTGSREFELSRLLAHDTDAGPSRASG